MSLCHARPLASAMSIVLFLIMLVFTALQFKFQSGDDVDY